MKPVTMWTGQQKIVLETIEKTGEYYVKKEFIDQKYQETSWIFKEAYSFFARKASEIVAKPEQAESPVWLFKDRRWVFQNENTVLMKLTIPDDEIVLFDMNKWNKILNLSYLGDAQSFEEKLKRQGITDPLEIFSKPFYPLLKKEVADSWTDVFQTDDTEEQYIQGAVWRLKRDWIEEINP